MLTDFLRILARASQANRVQLDYWRGSSRKSQNMIELSTGHRTIVLHLKESNKVPGWWGLNPGQLSRLVHCTDPWAVGFLSGPRRTVYLATPHDVQMRAGLIWRQAPKDLDFKVHENAELYGIASLDYSDLSNYLVHLLTDTSDVVLGGSGTRKQRQDGYETLVRGNLEASHIAEFLVRVPGIKRHVARLSASNLRLLDLLAGLTALILAPGDSPSAVASKVIPLVARMIQVLSDEEALVVRALCELAVGHPHTKETELLRHVNEYLINRKEPAISPAQLGSTLGSLAKKKCVERVGINSGWRLSDVVL